jgi:hypothetical protein
MLAMPPAGRYQALIDGQPGTVHIGPSSHGFVTSVNEAAERMTIRYLRRLD